MTKIVQQAGGAADVESGITGPVRQLRVDTTNNDILVHDGVTPGGHRIPNQQNNDSRYQARTEELDGIGPYTDEQRGLLVRRGPADFTIREILAGTGILVANGDGFSGNITISIGNSLAVNLDARGKALQLDDGQIPASKISGLAEGGGVGDSAANVSYNNSTSGLSAGNVQAGIDEIVTYLNDIQDELTDSYNAGNATAASVSAAYSKANAASTTANASQVTADSAYTRANAAFTAANSADAKAASAYSQANTATSSATSASTLAGNAYTAANSAASTASSAFGQANTAYSAANSAAATAGSAYGQANSATSSASTANSGVGTNAAAIAALTALLTAGGGGGVPVGFIAMWSGSVASIPAHWHLCDGSSGTPDLRNRFIVGAGSFFNPGDGDASPTHSHGVTVSGAGTHDHSLSVDGHSLSIAEMPTHNHTVAGGTGTGSTLKGVVDRSSSDGSVGTSSVGSGSPHNHGITVGGDGSHSHTASSDVAGALPPYLALAYIMRIS